jgi:sec-independent protein translocase protein TatA
MEGLFQPSHLILIFAVALLVFGPKKLPELGKGIGEGFRALRDGMKEASAEPKAAEPISNRKPDADVKS